MLDSSSCMLVRREVTQPDRAVEEEVSMIVLCYVFASVYNDRLYFPVAIINPSFEVNISSHSTAGQSSAKPTPTSGMARSFELACLLWEDCRRRVEGRPQEHPHTNQPIHL